MGAHLRVIQINNDDIEINGIIIDGDTFINNAIYISDTANHTGFILKWCNVKNFQGIAIDLYDDGTDLDAIINNNLINSNGNGIRLDRGGNTIN